MLSAASPCPRATTKDIFQNEGGQGQKRKFGGTVAGSWLRLLIRRRNGIVAEMGGAENGNEGTFVGSKRDKKP